MSTPTYVLPIFNLLAQRWATPNFPAGGPATDVNIPCQNYVRTQDAFNSEYLNLRIPWLSWTGELKVNDIWESPIGSGRYYNCNFMHIAHEGFPNQYVYVVCSRSNSAGGSGVSPTLP